MLAHGTSSSLAINLKLDDIGGSTLVHPLFYFITTTHIIIIFIITVYILVVIYFKSSACALILLYLHLINSCFSRLVPLFHPYQFTIPLCHLKAWFPLIHYSYNFIEHINSLYFYNGIGHDLLLVLYSWVILLH